MIFYEYVLDIPEGSRYKAYLNDLPTAKIEIFLDGILRDCMNFLKKRLGVTFKDVSFEAHYNSKEVERIWCDTDQSGKCPPAFIIHSYSRSLPDRIIMDLEFLGSLNGESFVLNVIFCIMEELLHSIYPLLIEEKIKDFLYSLAEDFLGIKIPEGYKQLK